jgi:hypothetical protein
MNNFFPALEGGMGGDEAAAYAAAVANHRD